MLAVVLATGGQTGSPSVTVRSWNGSNWTEVNDLNASKTFGANGTTTSGLIYGGEQNTEL